MYSLYKSYRLCASLSSEEGPFWRWTTGPERHGVEKLLLKKTKKTKQKNRHQTSCSEGRSQWINLVSTYTSTLSLYTVSPPLPVISSFSKLLVPLPVCGQSLCLPCSFLVACISLSSSATDLPLLQCCHHLHLYISRFHFYVATYSILLHKHVFTMCLYSFSTPLKSCCLVSSWISWIIQSMQHFSVFVQKVWDEQKKNCGIYFHV